jgi:rare lipoprotein A
LACRPLYFLSRLRSRSLLAAARIACNRRPSLVLGALAAALALASACGPERQLGPMETPPDRPAFGPHSYQKGCASWYGADFAGRPTASGDLFRPRGLTAAHRTLPLGSKVLVTNLENGRSVVVRINDRGPYVPDRVLDCSEGAARALGFRGRGLAKVAISLPRSVSAKSVDDGDYWLQLGAFRDKRNASDLQARLAELHHKPVFLRTDGPLYRVHTGPYDGLARAEKALRKLEKSGYPGYVVRLD